MHVSGGCVIQSFAKSYGSMMFIIFGIAIQFLLGRSLFHCLLVSRSNLTDLTEDVANQNG